MKPLIIDQKDDLLDKKHFFYTHLFIQLYVHINMYTHIQTHISECY